MKSRRTFLAMAVLAGCFLFALLSVPALASAKKAKPVAPPDRRYLVQAIDKANNTISISSKIESTTHIYHIDDMTTVLVDGASAKFADIKTGMEVNSFAERDNDSLDSVSLLSKTSAPAAIDPSKPVYTGSVSTVESVLADKSSVVIFNAQTKQPHTYRVDGTTMLTVNNVMGKLEDIKPGMVVTDYVERDSDNLDSLTLTGYGGDDSTPAPTAKKKK